MSKLRAAKSNKWSKLEMANKYKFIFHYHRNGEKPSLLKPETIFVFGSNLAGIHGAGAALEAVTNYGARRGVGYGQEGRSFALPTKDTNIRTLPLTAITKYAILAANYISHRICYAHEKYWFTAVGTGLAGYTHADIAPLFADLRLVNFGKLDPAEHLSFPEEWRQYIEPEAHHEFMLNEALFNEHDNKLPSQLVEYTDRQS